jgi:hypothetical protein
MQDSIIRLGLVQWQMRHFKDIDAFYEQVEFFVDVMGDYKADFVLFRNCSIRLCWLLSINFRKETV